MRERSKEILRRWGFANLKELLDVLLVPVVLAIGGLLTLMLEAQQEERGAARAG